MISIPVSGGFTMTTPPVTAYLIPTAETLLDREAIRDGRSDFYGGFGQL
jgi:hypothetical protein